MIEADLRDEIAELLEEVKALERENAQLEAELLVEKLKRADFNFPQPPGVRWPYLTNTHDWQLPRGPYC